MLIISGIYERQMMSAVLTVVIPVFGVLLIGYLAARFKLFDEQAIRGLSLFVFNFAIPALLFRSLATAELPAQLPWDFLLSYYLGAFAVLGLGMLSARWLFGRTRLDEQGILGFTPAFSNTLLLGVPLILTALGETASLPLFIIIAVHSPLLMPTITVILEIGRGSGASLRQIPLNTLKGLAQNPIILGLTVGLLVNFLDIPVPATVDSVAQLLSTAVTPCALFAMGAALSRYRIAGNLREALLLVLLKNFVHPLLVWTLGTQVFTVDPHWILVALLLAAMPSGVNGFLFAQRYQVGVATVTTAIFLSTAASVVTLSVLLYALNVR